MRGPMRNGPRFQGPRTSRGGRVRRRLVDDRRHARQLVRGRRPGGQALRARRGSAARRALLRGPAGSLSAGGVPARERGGRHLGVGDLSHRWPGAVHGARPAAPVGVLPRRGTIWLVDFCRKAPERLRGIAMFSVEDAEEAAASSREAPARPGRRHDTVAPLEDRIYDDTRYEPVWAAARISTRRSACTSRRLGGQRYPDMVEQPHVAAHRRGQRGRAGRARVRTT